MRRGEIVWSRRLKKPGRIHSIDHTGASVHYNSAPSRPPAVKVRIVGQLDGTCFERLGDIRKATESERDMYMNDIEPLCAALRGLSSEVDR